MQAERHPQVLRRSPQRLIARMVVTFFLRRILRDHGPGKAHLGGTFELVNAFLHIVQVDHGNTLEPVGVGTTKLG